MEHAKGRQKRLAVGPSAPVPSEIVLGSQEVVSSRKSLSYCCAPTSWAGLHDAALLGSHASCVGPQVLAIESDAGIIPTNPV